MFSKFFIKRPILAIVIAVFMILVGLITVKSLPITKFPNIELPHISVSATYPGADAKTVAETVGVPIEEQINGVEDMLYMSSTSNSDGSYSLTVTFKEGTDIDMAQVRIENRVQRAEAKLPSQVKEQGIDIVAHAPTLILFVAIQSDTTYNYDALYLTNYAELNVVNELERVPGVGMVQPFGSGVYSMRIWLDPAKMQSLGLSSSEVVEKIQSQNMAVSAGSIGSSPTGNPVAFDFTLTAQGRLKTPEEFENIILRSGENNALVKLKDVARVELGSKTYTDMAQVKGRPAGVIGIRQLPGANALDVANAVEEKMKELAPYFPPGVTYSIAMNATNIITASLDDLMVTFIETTLIVMIVIFIFLQRFRLVIIPMLTIPVSLIATFAMMKLLGFTINNLTMFGMLLAIAIVVDDAIVVVEDCARIIQKENLSVVDSVTKAMKELQAPIIGEVLVLLSVFVPTAFVSGITGALYKQFALTIASAVAFSGFNALTFTPAMCALFLKKEKTPNFFLFRWFNSGYNKTLALYNRFVATFLKKPYIAVLSYIIITVVAFWGFVEWPTSYLPKEDLGYILTSVKLPDDASLERTDKVMAKAQEIILQQPEVENVVAVTGTSFVSGESSSNYGSMYVVLKPWDQRKGKDQTAFAVIDRIDRLCDEQIPQAEIYCINPPSIPGVGSSSGLKFELLDINNLGAGEMMKAVRMIQEKGEKDPRFAHIRSLYQGNVPQYKVNVNRDRLKLLGLDIDLVFQTLSNYVGGSFVNDFVDFGRIFQVTIQGEGSARDIPQDVLKLTLPNNNGEMVPFSSFVTIEQTMGQSSVDRYNTYNSASLIAIPAKGISSDEGLSATEDLIKEAIGNDFSYSWTGLAYQESKAGTTIIIVLIFAIIVTLLVLAAQYESLTDPIAIIISMPTAILGTVLGCVFLDESISVYTQIGIILLIGMAAKNAILIVEYAKDYRNAGNDIKVAAAKAGDIRFRPIMMTAFAFVFGVMPMIFATGAGAESRISLGTAVVFGMAVNAIVGTLFVPNFWALLESFREKYLNKLFHHDNISSVDRASDQSDSI